MRHLYLLLCLCTGFRTSLAAEPELRKSIVQIYSKQGNLNAIGSGFWASSDGEILTAYHVVEGAKEITIFDQTGKRYTKVRIAAIDAERDLVLLKIPDVANAPFLVIQTNPPVTKQEVTVIGFPLGNKDQTVTGKVSSKGIFISTELSGENGKPIFEQPFKVFMMELTAYRGMSGAPVVDGDGRVIGVFQGSLNQGGALGWAIAADHLENLMKADRKFYTLAGFSWPELMGNRVLLRSFVNKDNDESQKHSKGLASLSASGFTFTIVDCRLANGNLSFDMLIKGGRVDQAIMFSALPKGGIRDNRIGTTSITDQTSSTFGANLIEIGNHSSANDPQQCARTLIIAGESALARFTFLNVPSDMKYLAALTIWGGVGNVNPYSIDTVPLLLRFRKIPIEQ